MTKEKKDENAIVLDYLQHGRVSERGDEAVAEVVGTEYFSILEVVLRDDVDVEPGDEVYIGEGKRDEVKYIKKSLDIGELTTTAKDELEVQIENLIEKNEDKFVNFFNKSGPISPRMHQLEALPGVGKKHMWEVIDERKVEDFESLEDLKERVPLLPEPKKMLKERILDELRGDTKHYLFTIPKKKHR
ncbi:MAG: DUF655 domain-containing protein [Candidatus Aenigmatarchaeota archaeon]